MPQAAKILSSESADLKDFGKMLHETWMLKRSLTDKISNSLVDEIYDTAFWRYVDKLTRNMGRFSLLSRFF